MEVPALVSKRGIQGNKTNGLPDPLVTYILRDRVAPAEMEIEAYETMQGTFGEKACYRMNIRLMGTVKVELE